MVGGCTGAPGVVPDSSTASALDYGIGQSKKLLIVQYALKPIKSCTYLITVRHNDLQIPILITTKITILPHISTATKQIVRFMNVLFKRF